MLSCSLVTLIQGKGKKDQGQEKGQGKKVKSQQHTNSYLDKLKLLEENDQRSPGNFYDFKQGKGQ